MIVDRLIVGNLETNCYILILNNDCLIVDPGADSIVIKNYITANNLRVLGILITHYHSDHIGALTDILKNYPVRIYDYNNIGINEVDNFKFETILNPGHSIDSVSFYFRENDIMLVGDFIFKKNIGRCDLPTGNYNEMLKSLKVLKGYPEHIILYPGHGDKTTLNYELKNNQYLGDI